MTKREFYNCLRWEVNVSLSDICDFIRDNDLYDIMELTDEYAFEEYVWDEIHNWDDSYQTLGEWLVGLPSSEWYLREPNEYYEPRPVDDSDIPWIIDSLEAECEDYCGDWYDDDPDNEENEPETETRSESTTHTYKPALLNFEEEEIVTGDVTALV